MRFGGSEIVTNFNKRAAGLFFNPFVETDLGVLKYGVISTERAVDDLENWTSLYLSGRLHKPVKVIFELIYILFSQKLSEMITLTKKIGQISPKKRENVRKSFLKLDFFLKYLLVLHAKSSERRSRFISIASFARRSCRPSTSSEPVLRHPNSIDVESSFVSQ